MAELWNRISPPPLALTLIAKLEAFSTRAYADSIGRMTIGYGSTVMPNGKAVQARDVITAVEGQALLGRQAQIWCTAIAQHVPGPLTVGEASALVSFVHNLGAGVLGGSTLVAMLDAGRHDLAERQFGAWVMAGGRKSLGLMRRRELERRIFGGAGPSEYDAVWRMGKAAFESAYALAFADAAAWRSKAARPPAAAPMGADALNGAELARVTGPGSPG